MEKLKSEPLLLDGRQEGPRADAVVEVAVKVLAHQVCGLVRVHPPLERPHMRQGHVRQALPNFRQPPLVGL